MKNNSKNNNRSFKPLKISDSLKDIKKNLLHKFGKIEYIIHAKWREIVGTFFFEHSEPQKITSIFMHIDKKGDDVYQKILHINVTPSAAVEFQHFQDKVIEKINSYFGYKAIEGIRIHQNLYREKNILTSKNIDKPNNEKILQEIKKSTHKIDDKKLQQSIVNLGLSINNEKVNEK